MPIRLEIVTAERIVYEDEVDMVIAPAWDGAVGILPHHAPLLTTLQIGELRVKKGGAEQSLVIAGGFMEVSNDKVTILADAAERAEEIDVQRAEQARKQAQDSLANRGAIENAALSEAQMRRAVVRLRVARRRLRSGQPESGV